jgi:hypothetical protein
MELAVARRENSVGGTEISHVASVVRDVVRAYRAMGCKNEEAFDRAGASLGFAPRRVGMFLYGEVFRLAATEYRKFQHRAGAAMDRVAGELEAEAIRYKKQAEAEQIKANQPALPLELPCGTYSPRSGAFYGGATLNAGMDLDQSKPSGGPMPTENGG